MQSSIHSLLPNIVQRWCPAAVVSGISPITPDASLRRYYRLSLQMAPAKTVVAMVFDSVACPEHDGGTAVTSDLAYVELSRFFSTYQVAVPELYFDGRDSGVLLLEDLGDRPLIEVLDRSAACFSEKDIDCYYQQAIDQIVKIQNIPFQPDFFPYQRAFCAETYFKEMLEFRDFILSRFFLPEPALGLVEKSFQTFAVKLESFPRVLSHRDFHSWNLLLDNSCQVRVIDFQDALLATASYDVLSLLNDRDTDTALGSKRYLKLLEYFRKEIKRGDDFLPEYYRALLQRDLKVAGRFAKLSLQRGLQQYEKWIPGTLRRIGRTLNWLSNQEINSFSSGLYAVLNDYLPEVAEGAKVLW